jgi:hypothetical protein
VVSDSSADGELLGSECVPSSSSLACFFAKLGELLCGIEVTLFRGVVPVPRGLIPGFCGVVGFSTSAMRLPISYFTSESFARLNSQKLQEIAACGYVELSGH